jgi:hypothetical protein
MKIGAMRQQGMVHGNTPAHIILIKQGAEIKHSTSSLF